VKPPVEEDSGTGPVLVTGASGTLGKPLVSKLLGAGLDVRALSRRPAADSVGVTWWTGDLKTGEGLDKALAGVQRVVHCASSQKGDPTAAKNLIEAMGRSGTRDLLYISIVGVDRIPLGYYKSKLATERLITSSSLRSTILRTTQFHDLIARGCKALSALPVFFVASGASFQPIDAGEVADRLVELTIGETGLGRVDDMGGPDVRSCADLARTYLSYRGRRRPIVGIRFPGAAFVALRNGLNCVPGNARGKKTFDEFLEERFRCQER
jgi:uncharacterized protein YbjT (DUF2867 family)